MQRKRATNSGAAKALLALICLLGSVHCGQAAEPNKEKVDYLRDIEPIFRQKCVRCHGPDEQESALRLDRRENLLRGGDSGEPAVVPGKSDASLLIRLVAGSDPDLKMPPEGETLTAKQIEQLRGWIDQGAFIPDHIDSEDLARDRGHWSLQPIAVAEPPQIADPWISNPIDAFVLEKLRERGLKPSGPTDLRTLARRVYLVMHGLPPTMAQGARWRALDVRGGPVVGRPEFTALIDEVLQSPHYGERWAQHWLDVIRWAETAGFETNAPRPTAWPYRDWLIQSLNADKPFDQFVFEQLAGDTVGQDAAIGFLVAGPANLPGQIGRDEESMRQARQDELDEVIRTVSQPFLGMTVGCARCHSHKFDPITIDDYYSLQAVFAGLHYGERRLRGPADDQWRAQAPQSARIVEDLTAELETMRTALALRKPVSEIQQERFAAVSATAVRMTIEATANEQPASLYEFEVWTAGGNDNNTQEVRNIALAGQATASGFALENQTRHPDNLNDGSVDARQAFPWRSDKPGPAWIQVDLPVATTIDRIVWHKGYSIPADYEIAVRTANGSWQLVAHSRNRLLHPEDSRQAVDVHLVRAGGDRLSAVETKSLVALNGQLRAARSELARLSRGPQVFAASFTTPDETWVLRRGDPMQPRRLVQPAVPKSLGEMAVDSNDSEEHRRVALARFLASDQNPLTARVIVNRIWQHHFGTGIVDTPSDFGRMGSRPTHPELLDWLARQLIENGWSLKQIHRLILSSSTFRQTGAPRNEALAQDADSRLLWRFPPRRLDGEALRDSILLVSGKLNETMGGPGFDFFNQKGGLSDYIAKETFESAGWRRMIYATKIRMQAVDIFGSFDCPDSGQMTPRRTRSITPVQALNLLNSPFVNRHATFMAVRVRQAAGAEIDEQVTLAMRLALNRSPANSELAQLRQLAEQHSLDQVCRVLLNANEFVLLQ